MAETDLHAHGSLDKGTSGQAKEVVGIVGVLLKCIASIEYISFKEFVKSFSG